MKVPLAEQLRPQSLEDVVGQDHLVGESGWITRIVQAGHPLSILLWGPPGSGKTTLARLYAQAFRARFIPFSAVANGIADIKKVIKETIDAPLLYAQPIVFIDEIHRFNKAQQDAFLPFLEDGTLILIGATTENPSFALNNALLSRLRVLQLNYLDEAALNAILNRYEAKYGAIPFVPETAQEARKELIHLSQGDGRHLLNLLENLRCVDSNTPLDLDKLHQLIQKRPALYDRDEEGHYNIISALHKAVRGSDPDAALYWFTRMIEGGEDVQFLARRLIRMATEDVGLADPQALSLALSGWQAFHQLGSPEGELALAEVVVYLALAPKSNAIYTAYKKARAVAKSTSHLNPPKTILNAPTKLMKDIGYGKDYLYDHATADGFSGQHYFPDKLPCQSFYTPYERGFEREMKKRLDYFTKLRKKLTPE